HDEAARQRGNEEGYRGELESRAECRADAEDEASHDDGARKPPASASVGTRPIESPAHQPLEDAVLEPRQILVEIIFQIGELHFGTSAGEDPAEHLLLVGLKWRWPRRVEPLKDILPPLDQPEQR